MHEIRPDRGWSRACSRSGRHSGGIPSPVNVMNESTPVFLISPTTEPRARFDPAAIFEPGAILPEQLDGVVREGRSGSRGLMLAVLEEAILCILGNARATATRRRAREAARAKEWVRAEDPSYLFSFDSVCAVLEIAPEPLRDALLNKVRHDDHALARPLSHRVLRNRRRVVTTGRQGRRSLAKRAVKSSPAKSGRSW
jgi:hypothetical protein